MYNITHKNPSSTAKVIVAPILVNGISVRSHGYTVHVLLSDQIHYQTPTIYIEAY